MTVGVFVSPLSGSNDNPGTQARPVATIAKALTLAASSKRIYVCSPAPEAARPGVDASDAGGPVASAEAVKLEALPNGFHLWGGFDCTSWQHAARATRVKTQPGQTPLTIANTSLLTIEDFEFEASDAVAPGQSSIAAFVRNSNAITLRGVSLKAGKGQHGADGAAPVPNYSGNVPTAKGAAGTTGGGACENTTCVDNSKPTSKGGSGGSVGATDGGADAGGAEPGEDGVPSLGAGKGGESGAECSSGGSGRNGAPAPAGQPGTGAKAHGTVTSAGWTPADGNPGQTGGPGQGGGGGASAINPDPGGGGGGGCGGCGGTGGVAGKGGGSSIALVSLDSTITLDQCTLLAQEAGAGGDGTPGQPGQTGGIGGDRAGAGCTGGNGGRGGSGGRGGGGAGGLSAGVAYKGPQPTRISTTPEPTVPTARAAGGNSSSNGDSGTESDAGTPDTQGIEGVSKPEIDLSDSTG